MPAILTFVLAAPLGAMGALAVGERRGGWDRPGRSAILGLIAGCLGLDRAAEDEHAALSAGLGLAIRREGSATALLSDYHTAQVPATRRNRVFATRREELAIPKHEQETVLTRRDYRADIAFTAALWRRVAAPMPWSLEDVAAAMTAPRFVPYLGRKSCPLGLPMAPRVTEAETVSAAFTGRDAEAGEWERQLVPRGAGGTVWADAAGPGEPALGLDTAYRETRRDEPISRARWQFGLREEVAARWPKVAAG
jgi:CRISPR system Cascade subunit CasD